MNTFDAPRTSYYARLTAPRRSAYDGSMRPSLARHIINSIGVFTLVAATIVLILNFMVMVDRGEQITPQTIAARSTDIGHSVAAKFDATITPVNNVVDSVVVTAQLSVTKLSTTITNVTTTPVNVSPPDTSANKPVEAQNQSKTLYDTEPQIVADLKKPIDSQAALVLTAAVASDVAPAIASQANSLPVRSSVAPTNISAVDISSLTALSSDNSTISPPTTSPLGTKGSYAYGQCTYYVASRRPVPAGWGNARNWLRNAQKAGWFTGDIPEAGAIAWTPQGYYGHVAYVERVQGTDVVISEMNYVGWNRIDTRIVPISDFKYIF